MSTPYDLSEHFWHAGSAYLLGLELLCLCESSFGDLVTVLQNKGTQSADIAYPSLHVLELECIEFRCSEPLDLRDSIMMRARHGVRMYVRLPKCSMSWLTRCSSSGKRS